MKKVFHQKLVRDKIPPIIKAAGRTCEVRVMEKGDFAKALKEKLIEEGKELQAVKEKDLVEEMADVLEVLYSLAKLYKIDFKLVEAKRAQKQKKRGGFKKRLFLVWSER